MAEVIRTIRLYGKLGARFGRSHRLAVQTAPEAARALAEMIPGFREEFAKGFYAVFLGKRNLNDETLGDLAGSEEIRIAPVTRGAKSGILGALAIVAGITLMVFGGPLLFMVGAGLLAVGAMSLLTQTPKGLGATDAAQDGSQASYTFNGAVNTQAQGGPVPLLYGRLIVGSCVGSAGIYTEDRK